MLQHSNACLTKSIGSLAFVVLVHPNSRCESGSTTLNSTENRPVSNPAATLLLLAIVGCCGLVVAFNGSRGPALAFVGLPGLVW